MALSHTATGGAHEYTPKEERGAAEKKKQVEVTRVQTDTARQPFFLPMPPTQIRWHFHFFFFILNNAIIFLEYFSSVGRSSIFQQNFFLI